MRFHETAIAGVCRIEIEPIQDERGYFARAWSSDEFAQAGLEAFWVQANVASNPRRGTLRGMHFQRKPHEEAKLVRCTRGRLFDVAVDLREGSESFGAWVGAELTAEGGEMLFIPPGCAHGYLTLEPDTDLIYLTSAAYHAESATGVRYDDPLFAIEWVAPIQLVSAQDRSWPLLEAAGRA
jgi:dTDP-4-dehydrorhamnose 3,5-epimerase